MPAGAMGHKLIGRPLGGSRLIRPNAFFWIITAQRYVNKRFG